MWMKLPAASCGVFWRRRIKEKNMFVKTGYFLIVLLVMTGLLAWDRATPFVTSDGAKTFIIDQRGERWDVTQAQSIGFKPEGFQYGIGRNAFTPLDETDLSDDTSSVSRNLRIIGISEGNQAQAYSVDKLWRHEIANSKIGPKPVAVGY
jgi:hypothetical protein